MKAIQAYQSIAAGDNEVVIAGGMESMSQSPMLLKNSRFGFKMGNQALEDSMVSDGLTDKFNDYHMGITAENLVENMVSLEKSKINLLLSTKAEHAQETGGFDAEIVPVEVPQRKGSQWLCHKMKDSSGYDS